MAASLEAQSSLPGVSNGSVRDDSPVLYGELVLLGYNGVLPGGNRGRRRSKYQVRQRSPVDCAKYSVHFVVSQPPASDRRAAQTQNVVVKYEVNDKSELFQIGRSSENANDFVVLDRPRREYPGRRGMYHSSVSRFACRLVASRSNPKVVRIYAGGFDVSKRLCIGENCIKFPNTRDSMGIDALTTNGVLICHPRGAFTGGRAQAGRWHEVSVCGEVLTLRSSRSGDERGEIAPDETNVLRDGSLIDLCGVTLLWRSAEALKASPSSHTLEALVDEVNAGRPQCPVGLNTLVLPRRLAAADGEDGRQAPYVYLRCGHVQGLHGWGREGGAEGRKCPMCMEVSPAVKLCLGSEPAFYVDVGRLTHAFNPCGHMASEMTVKYWAGVPVPRGSNGFEAMCPFCGALLNGSPGYVRLIFQDNLD